MGPLVMRTLALAALLVSLVPGPSPAQEPAPRPRREVAKPASSLPTLAEIAARRAAGPGTNAASDTFLVVSSAFDVVGGGCDPRGWRAEDRARRVFAHVSDRITINRDLFSWTPASAPLALPATVEGTPITVPQNVAVNDSGMVFYVESLSDGARIVAVYPDQNVMRKYADLPTFPGVDRGFDIAYSKTTGGLIVGSAYGNGNGAGLLYHVPAGGGTPERIAGYGFTLLDAPAHDAALGVPEEIVTDAAGNIYFSEIGQPPSEWPRVRMLRASDSTVVTLAGRLFWFGDGGDGGPGTSASLMYPRGVALNAAEDTLFVLDGLANRVRTVSLASGIIDALPGAQYSDFLPDQGLRVSPYNLTWADGRLYVGCFGGAIVAWSGGSISLFAGQGTSIAEPGQSSLGTTHDFGGTIEDLCPAPGGGLIFRDERSLLYRLDAAGHVSTVAGVHERMLMGERALWFGADSASAPDEVAGWVNPQGYGASWGQRLTSPPFSFTAHPTARLSFDIRADLATYGSADIHEESGVSFFAVRGLQADGTWTLLPMTFVAEHAPSTTPGAGSRLAGTGLARCEVDLAGATLADPTRLQVLVQTDRFGSNEDGFGPSSGLGALVLDNVRLTDGGDVLAPLDFEDGTTGAWTLSAVNAPYATDDSGEPFLRDFPPPATDVVLRSGFDFADPTCAWTFTSEGDSVPNGTFARITSPWLALADRSASAFIAFSGKLATDNQRRYLKAFVRGKDAGDERPDFLMFSNFIYSSGTTGSDLSSPFLDQLVFQYPDDFDLGTEGSFGPRDSIQIVLQIEDRIEENGATTPEPRVPGRLPYLDDIRVYQLSGDADHDGVPDALDACPGVSAAGQDADGDGCVDPTATLRHVENWNVGDRPIRVRIAENGDPAISDGSDLQAVRDAIAAWTSVPGADVPLVEDPTTSQTNAAAMDGVNLITWDDDLQFSPDILAVTPTTSFTRRAAFDDAIVLPGQIVDSDLIFNPAATYRTATTGPIPNSADLQSVATHEIGHLLGLSHSGVAEATMFPVLQPGTDAASLAADDRAAIGAAYPSASFELDFATLAGTVLRGSNGQPIPGALVTAWTLDGDDAPLGAVASDYTDEAGAYALRGLAAGSYGIKVEPLDGAHPALIPAAINARVLEIAQTNFTAEWWSTGDDGIDSVSLVTPVAVAAGEVSGGHAIVTRIDDVPPQIVSVLPADAATGVGIDGRVLVNFSEPVEAATLSAAFALRRTGDTGRLGGQAQILNGDRTFIFTPDELLEFGTSYEIELTPDLTDRQGVALATSHLTHFSTLATPTVAIFDVQPRQAPPGAVITIRGQGFAGTVAFEWQSSSGTVISSGGSVVTPTAFVTRLESNVASGPVRIIADGDTSNAFNLTVIPPAPGVPTPFGAPVGLSFAPSDVALSPEGNTAFAVGDPGFASINLSPTRPGYRSEDFQALHGARRIALANDGRRAFVTRPGWSDLVEVDTDTTSAGFGHAFTPIPLPGPPGGVLVGPDGTQAFVTEDQGEHVWTVDIDPASASYRSVVRADTLAGVTLTGGLGLGIHTETFGPHLAAGRPAGTRLLSAPYHELYLTSSSHGLVAFNLVYGNFDSYGTLPCSDHLAMTPDGRLAVAIGSGIAEGQLTRGCLGGYCPPAAPDPLAAPGGRPRDLLINPRTGALFVVNSLAGQLQVLQPGTSGYVAAGQVGTGRSPVAVASDAVGDLAAVANAGDRSIGIYSVRGGVEILSVQPSAAMPGDLVVVRATGDAGSLAADLGGVSVPAAYARAHGLSFAVPDRPQGSTAVSLVDVDGTRSLSLPLRIVDPITALAPRSTGRLLTAARPSKCPDEPPTRVTALPVSRNGELLAAASFIPGCGAALRLYQLRDGAPEPLFTPFSSGFDLVSPQPARGAAFRLDGQRLCAISGTGEVLSYDADPASPGFGSHSAISPFDDALALAVDPIDGQLLVSRKATGSPYFVVDRYDPADSLLGQIDRAITDTLSTLAVSPDGRVLIMGGEGRAFFVERLTSEEYPSSPSPFRPGAGLVTSVIATSDGRRAVALFRNGEIAVWSLEPGSEGQELGSAAAPPGVTLGNLIPGPDPGSVLAGGSDGSLHRIDVRGAAPVLSSAALDPPAMVLGRTPDGRHLFVSGHPVSAVHDTVRVYSLSEASLLSLVSGNGQEALAGSALPLPIRVHLADGLGRPQAGALIEFSLAGVSQGSLGGSLAALTRTDLAGDCRVEWSLPAAPGEVSLTVRAPGLPIAPLVVSARASESAATAVPVITAFGPPSGSGSIAAGTEVFVRFSQVMDSAGTVPAARLRVGADVVPGSFRFENGGRTLFFRPAEPLPYLSSCVLEVDAGALDAEGQALAAPGSTSFTIQAEPALTIAVASPPAGAPGTAVTLNGQGFSPVPELNTVTFDGVLAPVLTASPTTLIARVPATATSGAIQVQVASVASNGVPFVVLPEDAVPGAIVDTLPAPPEPLGLVLTPDGRRAYVVSPRTNEVGALDIFTAEQLAVIPVGANPRGIAMLPDGSRAYVPNRDGGDVSVIGTDPDSAASYHKRVGTIPVGPRPVAIAVVHAGPQVIVVCEGDSSARVIDARRSNATFDQVVKNIPLPSTGGNVAVSPDGTRAFVATGEGVSIIDLATFVVKNVPVPGGGGNVAISPDGGLLFVITLDRHLVVIDVSPNSSTPNRVVKNVPLPTTGGNVSVSPDGTLLFVTLVDDGTVLVFHLEKSAASSGASSSSPGEAVTLELLATHPAGVEPNGIAVDPFGEFALVANQGSDDLTLILTTGAAPAVEVLAPNGGETLTPGMSSVVRWATGRFTAGQRVDLFLSRDLGATWEPIAADLDNDGEHEWLVSGPSSGSGASPEFRALLEVRARSPFGAIGRDTSDAPFAIFDVATPTLLVAFIAQPRPGGIELRWQLTDPGAAAAVTVERAETAAGPWSAVAAEVARDGDFVVAIDRSARPGIAYLYRLAARLEGTITRFGPLSAALPALEFALEPVAPNPSTGPVAIAFAVAREAHVRVSVIDVLGRRVALLADGVREPGLHRLTWNGAAPGGRAPAGLYFVRYEAAGRAFVRRFALTR